MLLKVLGSIGLGLVTGWLAGLIVLPWPAGRGVQWPRLAVLAVSLLSVGGIVVAWAGWAMALLFLICALFSFLAHRSWRKYLGTQAKSHLSN